MANITFNNNVDGRNNNNVTYTSYPIRRDSFSDIVTWADKIDWGEFNLKIFADDPNDHHVINSYESFIDALIANFEFLYNKINNAPQPIQYNVRLNITNGIKTPNSSQTVESGGSVSWTVTPNTGYQLPSSISGATISGNTITISNVTSDTTITINCESINNVSLYWYVGTTKPTALSDATVVTSYSTEIIYTNNSGDMAYVYALTDNNHNVVMYDAGTNWRVAMDEVDTASIPGYKIYKTEGMCAVGGSTKIVIS